MRKPLPAEADDDAVATDEAAEADDDDDDDDDGAPVWLAVVALIVGALGLLAGAISLRRRRWDASTSELCEPAAALEAGVRVPGGDHLQSSATRSS